MIFGLVFVSCDFEVGTNVSCEELTISPHTGLIFDFAGLKSREIRCGHDVMTS